MVVASAAFRREKQQHQDWFVQEPQVTTKDTISSSVLQDYTKSHHGPLRGDVDAASTATLTSADHILVRSQQNNLPQRMQVVPQPPPDDSVYYGTSRLPPPPPPPPPPPLASVLATSAMLSNISPLTNTIPRVESCADSSHASIPLPAQAHWQSLRRFVVLPRSPEDDVDTTTHSSYWTSTAPTMPMVPPPAPPKPASFRNRSKSNGFNNASCDDDVGVAGLTSFLDSITSLCVGEEGSSLSHRRRQARNQPNIPPPQYAPPPPYGMDDDTNSIQDDSHFHLEEEDSLFQLPISNMMMKRQPPRQQSKSSPPTWSYKKGVVYPIASYPARLNSRTLVEQRRQDLRQDSFFRPISDDEVSVQPQRKSLSKSEPHHSF